jgi:transcriptional regulator with XRE-family HTH domain
MVIMDKATLGARIREQRHKLNMTIEQFAETAGIGAHYLGEIERGVKMPSLNRFIKIINNVEISADEMLRDEVIAAKPYVFNEITEKLKDLTPPQLKMVNEVVCVMLENMNAISKPFNDFPDE